MTLANIIDIALAVVFLLVLIDIFFIGIWLIVELIRMIKGGD